MNHTDSRRLCAAAATWRAVSDPDVNHADSRRLCAVCQCTRVREHALLENARRAQCQVCKQWCQLLMSCREACSKWQQ